MQSRIAIDAPVTLFALALAVATTMLFGLLPAWRLASGKTDHSLRSGRTETAGSGARRLQRTLVVAEVALSIVPLACGGLMLRSFLNLLHSPLGFDPANVVTARIPINIKRYPQLEQRWAFLRDVLDRVRTIPEVQAVSAADPLPLAGQEKRRVGRADQPDAPPILATQQIAIPGYLDAIGAPLREGRDFTNDDVTPGRNVTIIDEGLAKRLWPEGAIGKHLAIYRTGWRQDLEVVGVTVAVRVRRVRDEDSPHFMMPYGTYPSEMSLVVKTRETAERIAPRIKAAVDASAWRACGVRHSADERLRVGFHRRHAVHPVRPGSVRGSVGAIGGRGPLWNARVPDSTADAGVRDPAGPGLQRGGYCCDCHAGERYIGGGGCGDRVGWSSCYYRRHPGPPL